MIALNSLCVVGLVVCVVFLAAIGLHWSVKRYLIPAIGRRQWLREYKRQRALEYAAMIAHFAPTPEETEAANYYFTSGHRDPLGHLPENRRVFIANIPNSDHDWMS